MNKNEIASKMNCLRQRLEEIQEYKRTLTEDGIKPEGGDKMLESKLVQMLLGLEKNLERMDTPRGRRRREKVKKKSHKSEQSKGLLDGVKKDYSKVKPKKAADPV